LRSMTGYGEAKEKGKKIEAYVQIKTVNHRFLDIEMNLPPGTPFKQEERIRDCIRSRINRGRVTVYVEIKTKKSPSFKIEANQELALRYHKVLHQLCTGLGLKDKVSLSHLLSLPEIIKIEEGEDKDELNNLMNRALIKALEEVVQMREKEGKRHLHNILKCLSEIRKNLLNIEKEIPLSKERYQEKIREGVKELLKGEDKEKIANELALFVNRADMNEEKVRFFSHLDQFEKVLKETTPVGKKLGFILQELQREVNTIGAKANSFNISYSVVQIKEEIERIREQIQNIE